MKDIRNIVRASFNEALGVEVRRGWWVKAARRQLLSSNEDMSNRYALIREFSEELQAPLERVTGITWPPEYDAETVASAVKFLTLEERERRAARKVFTLEADGLEITAEDYIEVSQDIFTVPKEEEVEVSS